MRAIVCSGFFYREHDMQEIRAGFAAEQVWF